MEPLTTLSTALSVTKTLRDLVKGDKPNIEEIRNTIVALQDSLIDLQGLVLAGQDREAALTADKRTLEGELARLRDWQKEMSEYRLENIAPGAVVYVHQPSRSDPDTAHWLCQPCADEHRKKSVLQLVPQGTRGASFGVFTCPHCKSTVNARENRPGGVSESPEPSIRMIPIIR